MPVLFDDNYHGETNQNSIKSSCEDSHNLYGFNLRSPGNTYQFM